MNPFLPTLKFLIPQKYSRIEENDLVGLVRNRAQEFEYRRFQKIIRRHLERVSAGTIYWNGKHKCYFPYCRERNLRKLTKDHIVPIAVAYCLNWTIEETKSYKNLQLLCKKHHMVKDGNVEKLKNKAIVNFIPKTI